MSHCEQLHLGAIDTATDNYVPPAAASKESAYKCPECLAPVIFRHGAVRVPHFAHHSSTNPCTYYTHPSESQIHKDAKHLMAQLLADGRQIQFCWPCAHVMSYPCPCEGFDVDIPSVTYEEGDEVVIEYRSPDGKWIADVALVNKGVVRLIVEIKHTHKTVTERPEPWYEVDATKLIKYYNNLHTPDSEDYSEYCDDEDFMIKISCKRPIKRYCHGSFCCREPWVSKIPAYDSRFTWNNCIICNLEDYTPVCGYFKYSDYDKIRVCYNCLAKDTYAKERKLRRFLY